MVNDNTFALLFQTLASMRWNRILSFFLFIFIMVKFKIIKNLIRVDVRGLFYLAKKQNKKVRGLFFCHLRAYMGLNRNYKKQYISKNTSEKVAHKRAQLSIDKEAQK